MAGSGTTRGRGQEMGGPEEGIKAHQVLGQCSKQS